jgi:hypothetical protein
MAAVTSYISDAMRDSVGRELSRSVSFPVSASDIRRWAVAVYHPEEPPRLFWDEDHARTTVHGGVVAPEEFNPFAWMAAEPSGVRHAPDGSVNAIERTLGIEEPPLRFQLNGGLSAEYGVPIRPGDVITSVTRLGGYRERHGRLGLMLFTVSETTWTNAREETVKRLQSTLIRY